MGSLSVWNDLQGLSPRRPKRARIGGLVFALAVVLVAIWLLSRVQ
jgi:hypothetical protein